MRNVESPPTAPIDNDVYLVVDDFGDLGRAYLETDINKTDEKTVIADMLSGQFNGPVRVAFNTAEDGRATYRRTLQKQSLRRSATRATCLKARGSLLSDS